MRETTADTRAALWQALGLHVVLFALLFAGLHWTRTNVAEAARGEVIEADLVDISELSAMMQKTMQRTPEALPEPAPEPLPEPVPEEVVEPEPTPEVPEALPPPVPDPSPIEQEKVQRDAPSQEVATVKKEQDEKRKQPDQAELDAQKRLDEAREREKKLAEIRRQREQAAKERSKAEQRAQQLADARTTAPAPSRPPPGNPDSNSSKRSEYGVAIQVAVERQWVRPDNIPAGQRCQVLIVQIPGGEVVEVQISADCPYDALGRRSLEAAILKASPLPYAGFEDVFERRLVLNFEPAD